MSKLIWEGILLNYQHAYKKEGNENYMWMTIVVGLLMENRDLSMLHPIAKDNFLTVFIGEYYDADCKPTIKIEINLEDRKPSKDKYRIKFTFTKDFEDGKFYRRHKESVFCSWEKSLEVFDELFEKLNAATTPTNIFG